MLEGCPSRIHVTGHISHTIGLSNSTTTNTRTNKGSHLILQIQIHSAIRQQYLHHLQMPLLTSSEQGSGPMRISLIDINPRV